MPLSFKETTTNHNIVKFIECLIPITLCNLRCHYCYVIQRNKRNMQPAKFQYPVQHMLQCLTKNRFGGMVYFSICGAGETMLCPELPDLVKGLIAEGHIVNITTNGTCSMQLKRLINVLTESERKALHLSFSLHYLELIRLNLIEIFFENVKFVRDAGCSYFVQFNMTDEYMPHINDIGRLVEEQLGAKPQVAATRREVKLESEVQLFTALTEEEYRLAGKAFDSPLFECTLENFNKKKPGYCYAGKVSYVLNLSTGLLQACYASKQKINIFARPDAEIKFFEIGRHCPSLFCMNSSHFMALGTIPTSNVPSYASLRNRTTINGGTWYNKLHLEVLSKKIDVKELSFVDKVWVEIKYYIHKWHYILSTLIVIIRNQLRCWLI